MKNLNRLTQFIVIATALILFAGIVSAQKGNSKQNKKDIKEAGKTSTEAANVFNEIMKAPDNAIPSDLLDKAEAVAIFPGVVNAAFIFGGRGGIGLISRRTANGWSAPAFFKIGGGSFGLQIGGQKIDYVMLIMNDGGLKGLMEDKFELGGEASVAAGPVGRSAGATTNTTLDAGILSYSRTKGLFAGVSLKGSVITPDNDRNQAVYGQNANKILGENSKDVIAPKYVSIVPQTLGRYSSRKRN
ncbi:MAG: lipid-binding SYLF domain-containing protein [Acidobacteriota bacterium]